MNNDGQKGELEEKELLLSRDRRERPFVKSVAHCKENQWNKKKQRDWVIKSQGVLVFGGAAVTLSQKV